MLRIKQDFIWLRGYTNISVEESTSPAIVDKYWQILVDWKRLISNMCSQEKAIIY